MTSYNSIGMLIKQARLEKSRKTGVRYTQGMLAQALDISQGYMSDIENGRAQAPGSMLAQIAQLCDVPQSFFDESSSTCNSSQRNFVSSNIDLIRGDRTYEELSKDIAEKLNNPDLLRTITSTMLYDFAFGKDTPKISVIHILSLYAGVRKEFFYKKNTSYNLENEKMTYLKEKKSKKVICITIDDMSVDADKVKDMFSNENIKYLKFAMELREKNIDPENIIGWSLKR